MSSDIPEQRGRLVHGKHPAAPGLNVLDHPQGKLGVRVRYLPHRVHRPAHNGQRARCGRRRRARVPLVALELLGQQLWMPRPRRARWRGRQIPHPATSMSRKSDDDDANVNGKSVSYLGSVVSTAGLRSVMPGRPTASTMPPTNSYRRLFHRSIVSFRCTGCVPEIGVPSRPNGIWMDPSTPGKYGSVRSPRTTAHTTSAPVHLPDQDDGVLVGRLLVFASRTKTSPNRPRRRLD